MIAPRQNKFAAVAAAFLVLTAGLAGCRKADVDVNPSELLIGNDLQPVSFELSTTSRWSIVCENTWVTADPASGNGSATIVLTAAANGTGATRETQVFVNAGKAEGLVTVPVKVVQPAMNLSFSVDTLSVPKEGGTVGFSVISDGPWTILSDIPWVQDITPVSGVGDAAIILTADPSDKRRVQNGSLVFIMGTMDTRLPVRLEPLENHSPEIPELILPSGGQPGVSVLPAFSWSCSDPDGDELTYTLHVSDDRSSWSEYKTSSEYYVLDDALDVESSYWWKVTADDGNGRDNSVSESEVRKFTTGSQTHYADGEWVLIHEASVANPVNLVFTGDGYIKDDFKLGGNFISDMKEGVGALFSVEPYKEYESYFNVYAVAAWSDQRGMTITGQQTRNTRFQVTKTGDETTSLTCNEDTVFKYAEMVPVVKDDLKNTPVFVMSNQNIYAGTCYMYSTGESIAIIPVCRLTDPSVNTDYASILLHEGGGHAFGHLADEYISYEGRSLPQTGEWSVESVTRWQYAGMWRNISITNEVSLLPWSDLAAREDYPLITNPQGGLYYEFGVWRSEKQSCMIDNMSYYSAAQRLAIVKRLKEISGETFSLEDFMARDSVRTPPSSATALKSSSFRPLGSPVLRDRR